MADPLCVWFRGWVLGDGGSIGAISGWMKSKMAVGGKCGLIPNRFCQLRNVTVAAARTPFVQYFRLFSLQALCLWAL